MLNNNKIKRLVNNVRGRGGFEVKKTQFTKVNEHFFTKSNDEIGHYRQTLKAFTMIELLITMTLTGILVVFAFMGYNNMQQLFIDYNKQSAFISEYNQLNKALFIIADKSQLIEKKDEHHISFTSDSSTTDLQINEEVILLKFKSHTDTFHLKTDNPEFDLLKMGDQSSSYIQNFRCRVLFGSQKFLVSFRKQYDSESILKATLVFIPINE